MTAIIWTMGAPGGGGLLVEGRTLHLSHPLPPTKRPPQKSLRAKPTGLKGLVAAINVLRVPVDAFSCNIREKRGGNQMTSRSPPLASLTRSTRRLSGSEM